MSDFSQMERRIINLDDGWEDMQRGIKKLKRILEGLPESPFNSEEYMMLYTYPLCYLDFKSFYASLKFLNKLSLLAILVTTHQTQQELFFFC